MEYCNFIGSLNLNSKIKVIKNFIIRFRKSYNNFISCVNFNLVINNYSFICIDISL